MTWEAEKSEIKKLLNSRRYEGLMKIVFKFFDMQKLITNT